MDLKKEEWLDKFRTLPSRKLSDIEKQMIFILIEKSKVQRERSMAILNKGFLIFFAFIIIAVFGRIYNLITQVYINVLFILGILVLVASVISYHRVLNQEEKILDDMLDSFFK
ncbi:MAG TPA: hypothetical protein VI564_07725 [Candidatus Nanoarchaeia archaeon]|nr:hypothetical protein [Candidatus Nanoarchaeia archaeon]